MKQQRGLHLLELILIVAILGMVALAAIPHLAATDPVRLDLAAQEIADALRFARTEALRTGQPHGVLVDHDGSEGSHQDFTVYRVDTASSPFGIAAVLYHPADKQPFDRRVGGGAQGSGIHLDGAAAPFAFVAVTGRRQHLHFDSGGAPILMQNGTPYRLQDGAVVLGDGRQRRTVSVAPITGLVSVQ